MTDIAYACRFDPRDVRAWSGTPFHMVHALDNASGGEVRRIGPLRERLRVACAAPALVARVRRRAHLLDREPLLLRSWGRQVSAAARAAGVGTVVSPSSLPVAHLAPGPRLAVWTDATFAGLLDFYPSFTGLTRRQLRAGHDTERRMLDRADLVAYSSEWARRSAIEDYGADPDRVHVVEFGANLQDLPSTEEAEEVIASRAEEPLRLLLLGVGWFGKGAHVAVEVAEQLVARGIATELDIVGCLPPDGTSLPSFVHVHGFQSKQEPAGRARLDQLLRRAHVSILPTSFDCTPISFVEAFAYGVPCIAPDIGGIDAVIEDGRSGLLVPAGSDASAYVDALVDAGLASLARGARAEFDRRFQWNRSAARVLELLDQLA
jgi:glycosyltransferase involved in cell wall biosynthesis